MVRVGEDVRADLRFHRRVLVVMPNTATVKAAATQLQRAANTARPGGFIILSVGHGGVSEDPRRRRLLDFAPHAAFRVAGRNAYLVGDTPPSQGRFTSLRTCRRSTTGESRTQSCGRIRSLACRRRPGEHLGERQSAARELARLRGRWRSVRARRFERGDHPLVQGRQGVRVHRARPPAMGSSPIIGYPRRVVGQPVDGGRTRIFLEGDRPQSGTNIPFDEYMFPLSPDMVVFR